MGICIHVDSRWDAEKANGERGTSELSHLVCIVFCCNDRMCNINYCHTVAGFWFFS